MSTLSQLVCNENDMAFHPVTGSSYKINEIAKEIITLLQEGKTKKEIVERLAKEYDVEQNTLFIDVSDFVKKLQVYGLV